MTEKAQPKKRSGRIAKTRDGRWQAILTLVDGTTKRLAPFPKGTSKAMAKERAAHWQERVDREGIKAGPKPQPKRPPHPERTSLALYLDRIYEYRTGKGLKRQEAERARIRNHVEPVLAARGVVRMQDVKPDDNRAVVEALDAKSNANDLDGKTAYKVWASWRWVCKESCSSKVAAFRVRKDDPALGVQAPDKGVSKEKQWLTPAEFSKLMACEEVPVRWRRLYALAVYLCLRAGELAALECEDVDVSQRTVRVTKSMDRETREIGSTKTKENRTLESIPETVVPLLRALVDENDGTGRLVKFPPFEDLASTLRRHLLRAGVTRRELHEGTTTSLPMWFHDLRATGISWLATLPEWTQYDIRDFAGHSELSTTDIYVRRGRKAKGRMAAFPALPHSVIGESGSHHPDHFDMRPCMYAPPLKNLASPTGFEPVLQP